MILPRWILSPVLLALAGLGAGLGQSPWGLWYLALPSYALGLWLLARATRPALAGWWMGAAHFALTLHWITDPFFVDAAATGWLAPVALLSLAGGMAIFWGAAGWAGRRLGGGALGIALALAAAELTRAYIFTGFPWALPGHILIPSPALPSAAVFGAHGLGLCVLLGAGLVAARKTVPAAFGLALWALPFGVAAVLSPAPKAGPDAPVVRLVQPNAPQHQKWDPDWIGVFFRRGLAATAAPITGPEPALTVWPETSLPELLRYSEDVRRMIATATGGTPILIGVQRYGEDGAPRNSAALLTGPEGEVVQVQDKHRLVPFGEYMPLPAVAEALGLGPLASQLAGRYAPGDGPALIEVPGIGPVLSMICYEAIFPQDIRRVARPVAILHLTNDAWFGTFAGPRQHLALARLRAAESGLPLLRAANTGISAAIDARGTVLAALGLSQTGHLDVALPPALRPTLYTMTGDWAALLLILLCGGGIWSLSRRKPVDGTGEGQ